MASTHGLSARLHAMETRLDCITDTIEQFRSRMNHMQLSINKSMAINYAMLDMMYKLQPLANYLSPLSNDTDIRTSSVGDSGLGDMESSTTELGDVDDTCSVSARPAPLRRRRGRSDLKRIQDNISSSKPAEAEVMEEAVHVEDRSEIITICMMQDVAQSI